MAWFGRRRKSDAEITAEQLRAQAAAAETGSTVDGAQTGWPSQSSFTMPVEDVFTITGRGTVVTGRVAGGAVRVGQRVTVLHQDGTRSKPIKLVGVEAFRQQRDSAQAGDTVGLLLGALPRDQVARGDNIVG